MISRSKILLLTLFTSLFGCGGDLSSLLNAQNGNFQKSKCPGDAQGFYVCISNDSSIKDPSLQTAMNLALASLISLVNSSKFQDQISSVFSNGDSIVKNLVGTNYQVTITGYCNNNTTTLAQAIVGGDAIQYNECMVQKTASGQPETGHVAGVLLHEISHNIGYNHPEINPSRSTVPYYLGDLATSELGGNSNASGVYIDSGSFEASNSYHNSRRSSDMSNHRSSRN